MSVEYRAILWNRQKRIYDAVMTASVLVYLIVFVVAMLTIHPNATIETTLIRALGTCAFLLLNVALAIGPLTRLDRRFLPLLYNRRHLGVATFFVGLAHGLFSLVQFHALGDTGVLLSALTSNTRFDSLPQFPFQLLGLLALGILFLMAATSHDFWLHTLTPAVWKRLHMTVYIAYGLLVAHILLGALQSERSLWLASSLIASIVGLTSLHIIAAVRERRKDVAVPASADFIEVCSVDQIPEKRAFVAKVRGERVAVFKYDGKISAISNVCRHQNGPLGEGKIIDGCVTCPWHGYQYRPTCGSSPPPFTDKVETFACRVDDGRVFVNPIPNAAGTYVMPARVEEVKASSVR